MPSDRDLDAAGLPSTSAVQDLLDNAEDPQQAIAEFQEQNSLLLPSLKPVLKILELHGVRRKEYNELVLDKLSEKLLDKIKELGSSKNPEDIKKLELQLERSFKLYHVSKIRQIVLETLSRLPKVNNKILRKITEDGALYEDCNVNVKQQIWLIKDELFTNAVGPVLDSYVDSKERILTSSTRSSTNFFNCETTKSRRQWNQVKQLMTMIGTQERLYQKLINILRERFIETECPHYCSLRLELLMHIHDLNVDYASKIGKVTHDFSWCLDACVRDKHIDTQQIAKLKALLDKKKLTEENISDIAFVLGDSHTIHFLSYTAINILCEHAQSSFELPRSSIVLQIILRLLYLATSAMKLASDEIADTKTEMTACLTRFMPLLTKLIADDLFRSELNIPDEVVDEFVPNYGILVPDPNMVNFIKSDAVCALLWFHYTTKVLVPKNGLFTNVTLCENYMKIVCKSKDKILMKEPWASFLTHILIHSPLIEQNINNERFSKIIFHDYYMRGVNHNANNRFHLLHLYTHLMPHIVSDELTPKILKSISSGASFVGRAAAKRFEKEFNHFVSSIQNKNTTEMPADNHPIDTPSSDILSSMEFD